MKVRFKCAASIASSKKSDKFGYSRVYNALTKHLPNYGVELVENKNEADIQVNYMQPHRSWMAFHWWGRDRHPREVLYSTWETTRIPPDWLDRIKFLFSAIATPSKWCTEVFQQSGVDLPGFSIPHGVDAEQFPFFERSIEGAESKWWKGRKIAILWQGMAREDRKGRQYMHAAYKKLREIYGDEIWLIEKYYPMGARDCFDIIDNAENYRTYINRFMPRAEYLELLQACSLFIYPSRGEAFGLMPLETLCTGLPTMTLDWSGMTEYFDNRYFIDLPFQISKLGEDFFSSTPYLNFKVANARDAVPSVSGIVEQFDNFYQNRDKHFSRAQLGSQWVRKEWGWQKACQSFKQMCEKLTI